MAHKAYRIGFNCTYIKQEEVYRQHRLLKWWFPGIWIIDVSPNFSAFGSAYHSAITTDVNQII